MKKLCQSCYALTLKHASTRKSELIFMKSSNIDQFISDILFEAIPSMKQVYLYRQPLSTIRSYEKLQAVYDWEVPTSLDSIKFNSGIGQHKLTDDFPTVSDEFIESLTNFGRYSLKLAFSIAVYCKLVTQGYPIRAIKYDDILKDPKALFSGLLNHAEVPLSKLPDIKKVMSNDSQIGTEWSTRQVDQKVFEGKFTQITDDVTTEADMICEKFGVPRFWDSVDLPNKII